MARQRKSDQLSEDGTEELLEGRPEKRPRLLIFGPEAVSSVPLPEGGSVTVGRSAPAQVVIDDKSVSRAHAAIDVERGDGERGFCFWIRDLASSNGTIVRGERLAPGERRMLERGEPVEIGRATLVVDVGGGAGWRKPVPNIQTTSGHSFRRVIADAVMDKLYALVERVALSDISVLVLGETGVGKELMAREVHDRSPRSGGPFLALNCAAISEALLESELFGYEKGAFTGAVKTKPGLLEMAERGTIFLDEIGELPMPTQVRFLRVLEERRVWRVGGVESHPIDVRFVSATHRDLKARVAGGEFREDLFYRLNGIAIAIPPLRRRVFEIAPLARSFAEGACRKIGRPPPPISPAAIAALEAYPWPGNIRELRNVMERAVVLAEGGAIEAEALGLDPRKPDSPGALATPTPTEGALPEQLEQLERQRIIEALDRCGGNQTRAAEELGITRKVLLTRLDAYRIPRPLKHRP